jgi:type VI secretion system protein ImpM
MDRSPEVGFYGKLPSHGDFLRRRVSDGFVGAWDRWLQDGMAATRAALGEGWLEVYLTSPVWRFACAAGACGPQAVMGVMAPSVDRVGRYFPITIVAERVAGSSVFEAFDAGPFFEGAERLIIRTLEADTVDFNQFDERVVALADCFEPAGADGRLVFAASAAAVLGEASPGVFRVPLESPDRLGRALEQLAALRLESLYAPLFVFWTEGSSLVDASCLVSRGLPDPERFVALLDGQWAGRRWVSVPARVEPGRSADDQTLGVVAPCRFRSAAASHTGRVREKNQDAFLERPEVGVWAVADGLGGHSNGEVASRMVCDALADWAPDSSFERTIEDARRRIGEVNDELFRMAARSPRAGPIATTVVALLTRGAECAVIWAGDSRAYLLRAGELDRLTRDHSVAESDGPRRDPASNVVTRALGAESKVTLDVSRFPVLEGDRFLLCSDGLTRVVPDAEIKRAVSGPDIRGAVGALIKAALDAGGPDNVTALVVEAFEGGAGSSLG